jgi:hypothetical protein
MGKEKWTIANIPPMDGKIAVVTGANSGLGYYTSLGLAVKNATVVMACRNILKAETARRKIEKEFSDARLELIELVLAGLFANLIDNAFWGGSLDYITIKPFYTFDLKDLYITLCELFLITELVDNRLLKRVIKMPKDDSKRLNEDFMEFVKRDFRHLFSRNKGNRNSETKK